MAQARAHHTLSAFIPETLAFLLAVPLLLGGGEVEATEYYAAPTGNDLNDCLSAATPCQSAQAAVSKMPIGHHRLRLAPGAYAGTISVSHSRQVNIHGPLDADGACPNANLVTVDTIWTQDNATTWVGCLTAERIACRQWAIVDVANVIFNGHSKIALVANETCRINTTESLWINANVAAFAYAANYSTVYIGGWVIIAQPNLSPSYFVRATDATIDLSGATFAGHPLAGGLKYSLDHGVIYLPAGGAAVIPGQGFEAVNYSVCRPCAPAP